MKNSIKPYLSYLNGNNQLKLLNNSFSQDNTIDIIRKKFVSFNVFFYDLNYDSIDDQPKIDWILLLANILGICGGGFVGMTLLAIFEFFELCINLLYITLKFCFFLIF